jgi:hypothetical protein
LSRSTVKALYAILGVGVALAFLGHGILGLKGQESFVELVTGNYDKVLGGSMSGDAATTIVNVIGVVDVVLTVAFLALVGAALRDHEIAYSPIAIALFGYAMVWGFLTALSRFTAVMNGSEIWDFVERGPNFLLPAALVYLVYKVREDRAGAAEHRAEAVAPGGPAVPTTVH